MTRTAAATHSPASTFWPTIFIISSNFFLRASHLISLSVAVLPDLLVFDPVGDTFLSILAFATTGDHTKTTVVVVFFIRRVVLICVPWQLCIFLELRHFRVHRLSFFHPAVQFLRVNNQPLPVQKGFGVWGLGFGVWGLGDRKSVV